MLWLLLLLYEKASEVMKTRESSAGVISMFYRREFLAENRILKSFELF